MHMVKNKMAEKTFCQSLWPRAMSRRREWNDVFENRGGKDGLHYNLASGRRPRRERESDTAVGV